MAASAYLFDVLVRQQTQLEGLKAQIIEDFDEVLRDIDTEVSAALASAGVHSLDELRYDAFEVLLTRVETIVQNALEVFADSLKETLEETANHEAEFLFAALVAAIVDKGLVRGVEDGVPWRGATTRPIQATGQLLDPYLDAWVANAVEGVEGLLRTAAAQGWTVQQAITRIRGTQAQNYKDGLLGKVYRNAATVVRTTVQHTSNAARYEIYTVNSDKRGIVLGYRWVSVLDNRTTVICRSLDGQVFEIGAGPLPPIHENCRSTTMPELFDSVKLEESTRPSMFGPVRADLTYYDWLKLQPARFQDSVLGPTRGKLLRDGGLSAEEFARLNLGRTFKPLTLEEMRRRWPEIFERAGID